MQSTLWLEGGNYLSTRAFLMQQPECWTGLVRTDATLIKARCYPLRSHQRHHWFGWQTVIADSSCLSSECEEQLVAAFLSANYNVIDLLTDFELLYCESLMELKIVFHN